MSGGYQYRGNETPRQSGFKRLTVQGFQQFALVDLDLTQQMTIVTGANGAGKTTLLSILGMHFDWHNYLLANPRSRRSRDGQYLSEVRQLDRKTFEQLLRTMGLKEADELRYELTRAPDPPGSIPGVPPQHIYDQQDPPQTIGVLDYNEGHRARLQVPRATHSLQYYVTVEPQATVPGLYISSHRTLTSYQTISWIPAEFAKSAQILGEYTAELRSQVLGQRTEKNSMQRMKEALLAAAIYGEGNSSVKADYEAMAVWEGFQRVLRRLLPPEIGFRRLLTHPPEVLIQTDSGEFPIDSLSGGLTAIFELAWQIHLTASGTDGQFTVCFDEPENHLHPSLQRTLIPSLLEAFPGVSFVIATHSPFIVNATREASVNVLRFDSEKRVSSERLDFGEKSTSADTILREVLGMDSLAPPWADDVFERTINRYLKLKVTPENLIALRNELITNGLEEYVPSAVSKYLGSRDG